jgi:hypothetical protein
MICKAFVSHASSGDGISQNGTSGGLSDMDRQAEGRVNGSERVRRPTIFERWTFGVERWTFASCYKWIFKTTS